MFEIRQGSGEGRRFFGALGRLEVESPRLRALLRSPDQSACAIQVIDDVERVVSLVGIKPAEQKLSNAIVKRRPVCRRNQRVRGLLDLVVCEAILFGTYDQTFA